MSVTSGLPFVNVPVLSNTTKSTRPISSSDCAVLNRIPLLAPLPLPTMIATGVASPSAHGQLMTSTLMARASAKLTPSPIAKYHTNPVNAAAAMTAGTNTADTRSAIFDISAFEPAAVCTISMI